MPGLVLVDFDDTLVDTGPRFRARRERLFDFLSGLGFDRTDAWHAHHEVVDRELLPLMGYGPFRLGASFRDTYLRVAAQAGLPPDPGRAREAEALAEGIEDPPPPLPGAMHALRELARHHRVLLYTQSHFPDYQIECVEAAGVLEILPRDRVRITPIKDETAFRSAARYGGFADPGRTLMVGNSIRSDVNPALAAGASAIWIETGDTWPLDRAEPLHAGYARAPDFATAVERILGGR
jgi:putative hydrolase of the HAD superfamily